VYNEEGRKLYSYMDTFLQRGSLTHFNILSKNSADNLTKTIKTVNPVQLMVEHKLKERNSK
jgi:hypothetical protein